MKKFKIGMLCSNFESVPPKRYNFERITSYLVEELVKRGHNVTLFARGDSKTSAKLESVISGPPTEHHTAYDHVLISKAYQSADKFDIIHSQYGDFKTITYAPLTKIPSVLSIRSPLEPCKELFKGFEKTQYYVSVSNAQREQLPGLRYIATVPHGIPVKKIDFSNEKGEYLIFVGRMVPSKNPDHAIQAAKELDEKLLLLGDVPLSEGLIKNNLTEYILNEEYKKKLEKNIDNEKIINPGFVQHDEVFKFIKKAKALLFPTQYESFGVVMIEALACGTPVIAYDNGSPPEVVKHGETGFIVKDTEGIEGLVKAVKQIGHISREKCREDVEERFTVKRMVDNYEKVYQDILDRVL